MLVLLLILRFGVTTSRLTARCHRAATQAASAAGPLGVPIEEAARRGAEVDRILRQREEEDPQHLHRSDSPMPNQPAGHSSAPSPPLATTMLSAGSADNTFGRDGSSAALTAAGGGKYATGRPSAAAVDVPRLGKLEDRKIWALLAREAVQLGDCRAAAEYLAAAQRHNDAFHDRDNVIRCEFVFAFACRG